MATEAIEIFTLEGFDPDDYVEGDKPFVGYHPDKVHFFLHFILTSYKVDGKWGYEKADGWVQVPAEYVKRKVLSDYKKVADWLIRIGVIETDNYYDKGYKSKCYRIKPSDLRKPVLIRPSKFPIRKKAKLWHTSRRAGVKKYPKLWEFLQGLEIDYEEAVASLAETEGNNVRSGYVAAQKLQKKYYSFTVDKASGRLHTNLTYMPKAIRQFVTYKGQQLVEIDISNSQPFFANVLFREDFWQANNDPEEALRASKFIADNSALKHLLHTETASHRDSTIIMMHENLLGLDITEVGGFREATCSGQFYEYFTKKYEEETGELISREEAKVAVLMTMYSGNSFLKQEEARPKRVFQAVFPTIYRLFETVKADQKNMLALLLQWVEKVMVLDVVAKRFTTEHPETPIFSIHDSLVTIVGKEDALHLIMDEECKRHLGLVPCLKAEFWNP